MRAGSYSIRKFIEEYPVNLVLTGHIHEASGIEYLNSTIIVNPGSFKHGKYTKIVLNDDILIEK